METFVFAAAFVKRGLIAETLSNMVPFLNIQEKEGIYWYRLIVLMKVLFANHSITSIPKSTTLFFLLAVNGYIAYSNYLFPVPYVFGTGLFISDVCYWYKIEGGLEVINAILYAMSINLKRYEFLLDMYVSFCVLWYACQAYSREYQKLATLTILMLAIGWSVSTGINPYNFQDGAIFISFMVVIYYPLIPNFTTKYRHRLLYFYAVMFAWVLYKIHQNGAFEMNLASQNNTTNYEQSAETQCLNIEFANTSMEVEYTSALDETGEAFKIDEIKKSYSYFPQETYVDQPIYISEDNNIENAGIKGKEGLKLFGPDILDENDTNVEWVETDDDFDLF